MALIVSSRITLYKSSYKIMTSSDKDQIQKKITEVQTFPVLYPLEENQGNLSINTNTSTQLSKEQIITQAVQFHLEGNILKAAKYCNKKKIKLITLSGFRSKNKLKRFGMINFWFQTNSFNVIESLQHYLLLLLVDLCKGKIFYSNKI